MLDDLKNFRAEDQDSFSLLDSQTAGALLFFALAVALVLERMGII